MKAERLNCKVSLLYRKENYQVQNSKRYKKSEEQISNHVPQNQKIISCSVVKTFIFTIHLTHTIFHTVDMCQVYSVISCQG